MRCGDIALDNTLRAYLDSLRIEPVENVNQIGDRILEAATRPRCARSSPRPCTTSGTRAMSGHAGTAGRGAERVIPLRHAVLERELTTATPQRVTLVKGTVGAPSNGGDAVVLSLPAARPMPLPGFFSAVGAEGGTDGGAMLRFYVHPDDAEYAPGAWHTVLDLLESRRALPRQGSQPR